MLAKTARVTVLVGAILLASAVADGQASPPSARVKVRFLATSTSVRTGEGESEDVYLVEISLSDRHDEVALARLIDTFPSYRTAISPEILRSATTTVMRLRQDHNCDVHFGDMPLRTAPSDPMAILPERLGYDPPLSERIAPTQLIACYRIVRR